MKHLLLKTFLILTASIAFAQVPTNGLVGYWPFNGNANDASGNGNNGTVNGATLTTDRFGKANSAYSFNGVSDFISVNPNTSYCNGLSISLWCKLLESTRNQGVQFLVSKGQDTEKGHFHIGYNNSKISGRINGLSTLGAIAPDMYPVPHNSWINVVFTYNNNVEVLYIDGKLVHSQPLIDIFENLATNIFIGRHKLINCCQYFTKGLLDDIGIWNRALSSSEVTSLYNNENFCFKTVTVSDTLRISTITGLNELPENFGIIKIFPNPTNDVLNISVSSPSPNYTIKITNSTSQTLFTTQLTTSSYQLNLSTLGAKGLYFIQILDNTNKVLETKKLVLE
jgi:hypothetical protein